MRTVEEIYDSIREPIFRLMDNHNTDAVVALLDAFCVEAGFAVFEAIGQPISLQPTQPKLYSVGAAAWEKMRANRLKTVDTDGEANG